MTINEEVKELVTQNLYAHSTHLFAQFPHFTSFGWHQCTERWVDGRYITFAESLQKPDISGALGEFIREDPEGLQKSVADILAAIGPDLLMAAYGDGVDVAIYNDHTIEITNDTNRSMVFEL